MSLCRVSLCSISLCWVSQISPLCCASLRWMSLSWVSSCWLSICWGSQISPFCWVSLGWVSLFWMSWHLKKSYNIGPKQETTRRVYLYSTKKNRTFNLGATTFRQLDISSVVKIHFLIDLTLMANLWHLISETIFCKSCKY
jgi:hypothetical protein